MPSLKNKLKFKLKPKRKTTEKTQTRKQDNKSLQFLFHHLSEWKKLLSRFPIKLSNSCFSTAFQQKFSLPVKTFKQKLCHISFVGWFQQVRRGELREHAWVQPATEALKEDGYRKPPCTQVPLSRLTSKPDNSRLLSRWLTTSGGKASKGRLQGADAGSWQEYPNTFIWSV